MYLKKEWELKLQLKILSRILNPISNIRHLHIPTNLCPSLNNTMSAISKLNAATEIFSTSTYSPSGGVDRSTLPTKPTVTATLNTYKGGPELYAYCMWQVRKAPSQEVVVRAIASAVAAILLDGNNFTGSPAAPQDLTGYDELTKPGTDVSLPVPTNFAGAANVTGVEWAETANYNVSEMAAYFGVLCLAMCKQPVDGDPLNAFNKNRSKAATRAVGSGKKNIFVENSPWLTFNLLTDVHAAFNMYGPVRVHLIANVIRHKTEFNMGEQDIFMSQFMLLADFGMANLAIIRDALIRYPWLVTEIEGLDKEIEAANRAFGAVKVIDATIRPFAKAMYMNHLVFVNPADIQNLLGVCRFALSLTHTTYTNYQGGFLTDPQRQKIERRMHVTAVGVPPVPVPAPTGTGQPPSRPGTPPPAGPTV